MHIRGHVISLKKKCTMIILSSRSVRGENQMSSDRYWREFSSALVIWKLDRVNGLMLAIPMQVYPLFKVNRPIRKGLVKRIFWNSIRVLRPKCTHLRTAEDLERNVYRILRIDAQRSTREHLHSFENFVFNFESSHEKKVSGKEKDRPDLHQRC